MGFMYFMELKWDWMGWDGLHVLYGVKVGWDGMGWDVTTTRGL